MPPVPPAAMPPVPPAAVPTVPPAAVPPVPPAAVPPVPPVLCPPVPHPRGGTGAAALATAAAAVVIAAAADERRRACERDNRQDACQSLHPYFLQSKSQETHMKRNAQCTRGGQARAVPDSPKLAQCHPGVRLPAITRNSDRPSSRQTLPSGVQSTHSLILLSWPSAASPSVGPHQPAGRCAADCRRDRCSPSVPAERPLPVAERPVPERPFFVRPLPRGQRGFS